MPRSLYQCSDLPNSVKQRITYGEEWRRPAPKREQGGLVDGLTWWCEPASSRRHTWRAGRSLHGVSRAAGQMPRCVHGPPWARPYDGLCTRTPPQARLQEVEDDRWLT